MKLSEMTIKDVYAGIALIVAVILSFCGCFLDPQGIIDTSMLYLIAQFLTLTATLLGMGSTVAKIQNIVKGIRSNNTPPIK